MTRTIGYWLVVVLLSVSGLLGLFSIGMPFVLLAIVLTLLFQLAGRPGVRLLRTERLHPAARTGRARLGR